MLDQQRPDADRLPVPTVPGSGLRSHKMYCRKARWQQVKDRAKAVDLSVSMYLKGLVERDEVDPETGRPLWAQPLTGRRQLAKGTDQKMHRTYMDAQVWLRTRDQAEAAGLSVSAYLGHLVDRDLSDLATRNVGPQRSRRAPRQKGEQLLLLAS